MPEPTTLFEKVWNRHVAVPPAEPGLPAVLAIDLHLIHEVTSPQAFTELERRGLEVRHPNRTLATMDHSTPTEPGFDLERLRVLDPQALAQLERLEQNCARWHIPLLRLGDRRRGIVHVIGPELGLTQPGMTIVCGDSHTSTHGALGALAFGIGTSEVGHVLATQCLLQHQPKTFEVRLEGTRQHGVTAKDLILAVIAEVGIDGGTGHVFEYRGQAISELDMEGRMTICNMSIEGGARAGMVAPDDTTFAYLEGRPFAPRGADWERALAGWEQLRSDENAIFDRSVCLRANEIEPMITWGTNPGMAMPVNGRIPDPTGLPEATQGSCTKALEYMGLQPGEPLVGHPIDVVFIGSCTNSRLSDLESAATLLAGRKIAKGVRMLVVPGSQQVKHQAEERGLDRIFRAAGAEWREAGCSMCLGMNRDRVEPGQFAVSTTNRNFEGRQGPGSRTFLASPLTAAASALEGRVADVRELF